MHPTTATAAAPLFPLSMFDPVHLGMDENGEQVHVDLAERNMLLGGEPGAASSRAEPRPWTASLAIQPTVVTEIAGCAR